ncbi:MAG: A24 family peptidase [Pirellulaceae bacterium]|nr:A24 family peptidase [Pirellulaceae bacterium]
MDDLSFYIKVATLLSFTAIATFYDLRERRIPNALTLPLFLLGILFQLITGYLEDGFLSAFSYLGQGLLAATIGGVLFLALWLLGKAGAGDLKLIVAIGLWMELQSLMLLILLSTIATILLAPFSRWIPKDPNEPVPTTTKQSPHSLSPEKEKQPKDPPLELIPFGFSITIGCWGLLLYQLAMTLR